MREKILCFLPLFPSFTFSFLWLLVIVICDVFNGAQYIFQLFRNVKKGKKITYFCFIPFRFSTTYFINMYEEKTKLFLMKTLVLHRLPMALYLIFHSNSKVLNRVLQHIISEQRQWKHYTELIFILFLLQLYMNP